MDSITCYIWSVITSGKCKKALRSFGALSAKRKLSLGFNDKRLRHRKATNMYDQSKINDCKHEKRIYSKYICNRSGVHNCPFPCIECSQA